MGSILGIDPGTGILGFGVIDVTRGKPQMVDAGVIRTPVHEDDAVRLLTIYEELTDIITYSKPTIMSVEKLFFCPECYYGYDGGAGPRRSTAVRHAGRHDYL